MSDNPPNYLTLFQQNALLPPYNGPPVNLGLLAPMPETSFKPFPVLPPFRFDLPTSYHEGAHVVRYVRAHNGFSIARVVGRAGITEASSFGYDKTDIPFIEYVQSDPRMARLLYREGLAYIITLLAGPCAEARYRKDRSAFPSLAVGGRSDVAAALSIAQWLHATEDEAVHALLERAERSAQQFLDKQWGIVALIAQHLARYGSISGDHQIIRRLSK